MRVAAGLCFVCSRRHFGGAPVSLCFGSSQRSPFTRLRASSLTPLHFSSVCVIPTGAVTAQPQHAGPWQAGVADNPGNAAQAARDRRGAPCRISP